MLHRASMQSYKIFLQQAGFRVDYIETKDKLSDTRELLPFLKDKKFETVYIADPVDDWLQRRFIETCNKQQLKFKLFSTPNFLNEMKEVNSFFDQKKSYFQTAFYVDQRKKRQILLAADGEPEGGKWSLDAENRKKFPVKQTAPQLSFPKENEHVHEAREYISKHFNNNYGSDENFIYPVNFKDAEKWLDEFVEKRFRDFGIYEDAIVAREHFLHHAVISPLINIGLLSPQQVIKKVLDTASTYQVPLNSLEGFVRQVMGWREFIRIVYMREGSFQRTRNFWQFTKKIPQAFWTGHTGIDPIDQTIRKVLQTGYCHHIERLMILGNFMLLCEFDPDEVYRWFMEMFVDSYDWVMVPNVYGMVQFADGGLMTTKPYISGSNYILKMSDYKKGDWCATWDGLFWRFMDEHRDFFAENPRMTMMVKNLDRMPATKKREHLQNATSFLEQLN